jgi:scyllo-inositol 2-dehydrogenase (NADP+)
MKPFKQAGDIRVGVVGYGGTFNMGLQHLKEMRDAGMTPAAVCELDPKRLAAAAQDWPEIETYSSLKTMLARGNVDLVTIITPHNTHAALAVQALKAGRCVVCEKPLAITTAECDRMIAAAKASGTVITTYHNRHWDGCILQAVKTIRSGAIGDVCRIEAHMGRWGQPRDWWRSSRKISGGILYDWGVHLLEYSLQIIDSDIAEVSGFAHRGFWADSTRWKADTNEDEAAAVVRFSDGRSLVLRITQLDSTPPKSMVEITGTKGTYLFDLKGYEITTHRGRQTVATSGDNPPGEGWRFYRNVAAHLVKGEKLVITGEWARRPIHVLDLACRSARIGRSLQARYK